MAFQSSEKSSKPKPPAAAPSLLRSPLLGPIQHRTAKLCRIGAIRVGKNSHTNMPTKAIMKNRNRLRVVFSSPWSVL